VKPIDAEEVFLTNLCLIDKAIGYVCHRNRAGRDEEEEFGSYVKFKLIESNYAIIRKFEGRSAFSTYMTTVIQRMFFQYRVQMWGKWRPSAHARRLHLQRGGGGPDHRPAACVYGRGDRGDVCPPADPARAARARRGNGN
jgi:hypothetical protein